jgi:hypothetical protein
MSGFSRIVIGAVGLVWAATFLFLGYEAPGVQHNVVAAWLFASFGLIITLACCGGRVRYVAFRVLCCVVFAVCVAYVLEEVLKPAPVLVAERRSQLSVWNALTAFAIFGLPAGAYGFFGNRLESVWGWFVRANEAEDLETELQALRDRGRLTCFVGNKGKKADEAALDRFREKGWKVQDLAGAEAIEEIAWILQRDQLSGDQLMWVDCRDLLDRFVERCGIEGEGGRYIIVQQQTDRSDEPLIRFRSAMLVVLGPEKVGRITIVDHSEFSR